MRAATSQESRAESSAKGVKRFPRHEGPPPSRRSVEPPSDHRRTKTMQVFRRLPAVRASRERRARLAAYRATLGASAMAE
jgi:hypothetical protein